MKNKIKISKGFCLFYLAVASNSLRVAICLSAKNLKIFEAINALLI
jgi:hypothetical protein